MKSHIPFRECQTLTLTQKALGVNFGAELSTYQRSFKPGQTLGKYRAADFTDEWYDDQDMGNVEYNLDQVSYFKISEDPYSEKPITGDIYRYKDTFFWDLITNGNADCTIERKPTPNGPQTKEGLFRVFNSLKSTLGSAATPYEKYQDRVRPLETMTQAVLALRLYEEITDIKDAKRPTERMDLSDSPNLLYSMMYSYYDTNFYYFYGWNSREIRLLDLRLELDNEKTSNWKEARKGEKALRSYER